jgi:hypothetical protein
MNKDRKHVGSAKTTKGEFSDKFVKFVDGRKILLYPYKDAFYYTFEMAHPPAFKNNSEEKDWVKKNLTKLPDDLQIEVVNMYINRFNIELDKKEKKNGK